MADAPETGIEALFASLEVVEQQRPVLGDAVDAVVAGIHNKILSQAPPPSDEDLRRSASWQTLVETSQSLGLEMPPPTEEIQASLAAVERYQGLLQRLGTRGLEGASHEQITVAEQPEEVPAVPDLPGIDDSAANGKSTSAEAQRETPEELVVDITDTVITFNGQTRVHRRADVELYKQALVDLVEALNACDGNILQLTDYLKSKTGTTGAELRLRKKGLIEPVEGVDPVAAAKYLHVFYSLVGKLRDAGVVEHEKGGIRGTQGVEKSQSGTLKLLAPIKIVGTPPDKRPYDVKINVYRQEVENGRGRKEIFNKDPLRFGRVAKALGMMAAKTEVEQTKITRRHLYDWLRAEEPSADVDRNTANLSSDLYALTQMFEGAFPLKRNGKEGGAYFSWLSGSSVDIDRGWPEKRRFEEAVYLKADTNGITLEIDGVEHMLIDYANTGELLVANGYGLTELTKQNFKILEALSVMEERDQFNAQHFAEWILTPEEQKDVVAVHRLMNKLHHIAQRMNEFSPEDLVNWQNHNGVLVDINRRIIVRDPNDGDKDEPSPDHGSDRTTRKVLPGGEDGKAAPEIGDIDLRTPRADTASAAEDLLRQVDELAKPVKQTIYGRLLHHGTFHEPESLAEAAYLLKLLLDPQFMANVRENRRDFSEDPAKFNALKSDALCACYIHTLAWGDFSEFIEAVAADALDHPLADEMLAVGRSFDYQKADILDRAIASTDEASAQSNRIFMESALDHLLSGTVPQPHGSIQTISLIDLFRQHRNRIAEELSSDKVNEMSASLQRYARRQLGMGNSATANEARTSHPRSDRRGRATQTSGEANGELARRGKRALPASEYLGPTQSGSPRRPRSGGRRRR